MAIRIMPRFIPVNICGKLLGPLALTPYGLAARLGVPRKRIERLVREETGVTPDTALRLGRFFSLAPESWINMPGLDDLTLAEIAADDTLRSIEPIVLPAA